MQGKNKLYIRMVQAELEKALRKNQSVLLLGPRQVGKTTLVENVLDEKFGAFTGVYFQNFQVRQAYEKDPIVMIRQYESRAPQGPIFIDEAQKVPEIFDSVQYLIDKKIASFVLTGSSARKLRRKGTNLLPGRLKIVYLDPFSWAEMGLVKDNMISALPSKNINARVFGSFEDSLIWGGLPGIINQEHVQREQLLNDYAPIYLEEEIRAEALSRNIGAFSRFLELAAFESGTAPQFSKISMDTGVSAPAIKQYFEILVDTLIMERVDPYVHSARKRLVLSPRYYFFDVGVRNALARIPMTLKTLTLQKGLLFEHAVILEIIHRIRAHQLRHKVYFWRTATGLEVDCIVDTGEHLIPIEIKASERVSLSDLRGLQTFLQDYKSAKKGYVITMGNYPEKLSDSITAIPWNYL